MKPATPTTKAIGSRTGRSELVIPRRVEVFANAYGMTARHRAEPAPFAAS